ncbi:MAG: YfhL family 4Fe-4S dicluster ferredoxin [Deltaproteobacteria bacterium]|nr:YfhL family 4Fe-4S dicluster ferredoxin [Deltaproteobacteria bacterium]MBI2366155.1 YfhL family 4Fe-4S dicluster ferredoxin [Deltaproteobacteria bacterium]
MATMITSDCINCGACEPECPNNAIRQGDPVYVIDPLLCTECVGFHDYEACAAVCPVDCCVTDPNNIESEQVLIERARALHPETQIGESFESRFRKGQGKAAAPQKEPVVHAASSTAVASETAAAPQAMTGTATAYAEPDVNTIQLPEIDSWEIPMRCFKCNETHVESVRNFMIGNVIFCPHCHKSMVVRDNLNYHIRTLLKDSYERWEKEQTEFADRREKELAQFQEKRAKEAQAFQAHQERELEKIRAQLDAIGDNYDAAGKPFKKGSRFGWG